MFRHLIEMLAAVVLAEKTLPRLSFKAGFPCASQNPRAAYLPLPPRQNRQSYQTACYNESNAQFLRQFQGVLMQYAGVRVVTLIKPQFSTQPQGDRHIVFVSKLTCQR